MSTPTPVYLTPDRIPDAMHNALLGAFLSPSHNLVLIAEQFCITFATLLAWANSPRARADLEAIRELARFRAQLLADCELPAAVNTFAQVNADLASTTPDSATPLHLRLRLANSARQAATALQRMATPRTPPRVAARRAAARADEPLTAANPAPAADAASMQPAPPAPKAESSAAITDPHASAHVTGQPHPAPVRTHARDRPPLQSAA